MTEHVFSICKARGEIPKRIKQNETSKEKASGNMIANDSPSWVRSGAIHDTLALENVLHGGACLWPQHCAKLR